MGKRNKFKQQREERNGGLTLLIVGIALLAATFARHGSLEGGTAIGGMICTGFGLIALLRALPFGKPLPKKEVMKLAEARNGLLTLSEISSALDIDPAVAEKTLKALAKSGIAVQRWEEYRKNLWEFPDYIKLPLTETIDRAKKNGGRISLSDLLASGHSIETATQTLDALSEKGLAHQDPAATARTVILTPQ